MYLSNFTFYMCTWLKLTSVTYTVTLRTSQIGLEPQHNHQQDIPSSVTARRRRLPEKRLQKSSLFTLAERPDWEGTCKYPKQIRIIWINRDCCGKSHN